jgi:hypothetical protein
MFLLVESDVRKYIIRTEDIAEIYTADYTVSLTKTDKTWIPVSSTFDDICKQLIKLGLMAKPIAAGKLKKIKEGRKK